jgi:hypothetical protein
MTEYVFASSVLLVGLSYGLGMTTFSSNSNDLESVRGRFSTAEDSRYYKGNIRRYNARNLFVKRIAALKFNITCYGSHALFYNMLHREIFSIWKVVE